MPERKGKTVRVNIEVPDDVLKKIPKEKLAKVFKQIIETHAMALRIIMESKEEVS